MTVAITVRRMAVSISQSGVKLFDGIARYGKEQMMTNEEAIEALKRIRDEAMNEFIGDCADYEAFSVAIKALKGADDEVD